MPTQSSKALFGHVVDKCLGEQTKYSDVLRSRNDRQNGLGNGLNTGSKLALSRQGAQTTKESAQAPAKDANPELQGTVRDQPLLALDVKQCTEVEPSLPPTIWTNPSGKALAKAMPRAMHSNSNTDDSSDEESMTAVQGDNLGRAQPDDLSDDSNEDSSEGEWGNS
jgi:hypothetical protein